MSASIDTLKQAAQELRGTIGAKRLHEIAAALEAMAEQKPVAYLDDRGRLAFLPGMRGHTFSVGDMFYAAPIATPEHDAKVRDAALEEVVAALTNERVISPINGITHVYNSAIDASMEVVRSLKSTGADHAE